MKLAVALVLAALALPAAAHPLKPWSGAATPALELRDVEGRLHRLSDYRGSVVLVNFWATWCAPCREEMPSLERLRAQTAGQRLVVLAVNVGESGRTVRNFVRKVPVAFPLLLDRETATTRAWGARVLPASFVVGPDGRIRYSYLGALDWASDEVRAALEALLR